MKYSFEVAHIYADRPKIGTEQHRSIEAFKKYLARVNLDKTSYSVAVWLDDYNPTAFNIELMTFINSVERELGQEILLASEKRVATLYSEFEKFLDNKSRSYYERYLERSNKLPCSLVTAMWYCLRLEECKFSGDVYFDDTLTSENFIAADTVVNFLPRKFANAEAKTREIFLSNVQLEPYAKKIRTVFF